MDSRGMRFVFLIFFIVKSIQAFNDNDLTVHVPPGSVECFYQTVKNEKTLEIEYQVIAGGDLDIDFRVSSPSGKVLFAEGRKNDGVHTVEEAESGDYEICFSNKFSHLSSKTVFFELILDSDIEDEDEDESWKGFVQPDEDYGDKLASMEEEMDSIKSNMAKTIQVQSLLRVFEAKDRGIVERNFERINLWSCVNMAVMVSVFLLQVVMIRNMFSDEKKVRT